MQNHLGRNEREEIVKKELKSLYIAANESKPPEFDEIVKTWTRYLKDIPILELETCFRKAATNNRRFKLPTLGQVSAEHQERRSASNNKFSQVVYETMQRRIQNKEFFEKYKSGKTGPTATQLLRDAEEHFEKFVH